jgi:U4/U6 small nuclear ribonucleoprotein PRP31
MAESSLAADLLADFNDADEEELDGLEENGLSPERNGERSQSREFMELDGDEEPDEDEEMEGVNGEGRRQPKADGDLSIDDDEEVRKAKVEKMQLGDVDDVRSVAGLMKILQPVLEV